MFPTKAVHVWQMLDDRERASLVATYFHRSGAFGKVQAADRSQRAGVYGDPLFAVWAHRL
jgi:hypothetical protein